MICAACSLTSASLGTTPLYRSRPALSSSALAFSSGLVSLFTSLPLRCRARSSISMTLARSPLRSASLAFPGSVPSSSMFPKRSVMMASVSRSMRLVRFSVAAMALTKASPEEYPVRSAAMSGVTPPSLVSRSRGTFRSTSFPRARTESRSILTPASISFVMVL